ncbi:MAG: hypothetical protein A2289_15945 [Deltaproteobacteria bacterium RIFOXYA12_FULL_58_15]|nr:MAG: hypothetical protein A2289_15945 [Deltaproteobacteria bacterium RIFOXYA12_FULL_58_15]
MSTTALWAVELPGGCLIFAGQNTWPLLIIARLRSNPMQLVDAQLGELFLKRWVETVSVSDALAIHGFNTALEEHLNHVLGPFPEVLRIIGEKPMDHLTQSATKGNASASDTTILVQH